MFNDSWQTSHALMRTRRMCLCWLCFSKKKTLKLLQHRSILPILIGQVSELSVQTNSILNHLNNDTAFTVG